jgi:cytochrome b561
MNDRGIIPAVSGIPVQAMTTAAPPRYTATAVALHWLVAALIVCGFTLGLSMVPLPLSKQKLEWYLWHKSIGLTVFLLTCLRLVWRRSHAPPPLPPMPDWQRRATTVAHVALYVLLLVIPVSGWLYSSSTGVQVVYLGLFPLPDLVPKDKALAAVLRACHVTLNFTLLGLVCVHVAGALRHHFVDRDTVLWRMLPFPGLRRRSRGNA